MTTTKTNANVLTASIHRQLVEKLTPNTVSRVEHERGMQSRDPVIAAMTALHSYAIAHEQRFESKLADDYILGPGWLDAIKGVRVLLNGEGLFDGGILESLFWSALEYAGFTESDL